MQSRVGYIVVLAGAKAGTKKLMLNEDQVHRPHKQQQGELNE